MPCLPVTLKALKPKETDFEPETLGEHIRKRRLQLGLTQNEAGIRLEATALTVLHWEKGDTETPVTSMPTILSFLGYTPFPEPDTLSERMLALRRSKGWTIKEAAQRLGVDAGTWGAWERGETILFRRHRALIARLFGLSVEKIHREMRDRWIRSHSQTPTVSRSRGRRFS